MDGPPDESPQDESPQEESPTDETAKDETVDDRPTDEPWWGSYELPNGGVGRWEVGPRTLWLYHTANEWRVFARAGSDSLEAKSRVHCPVPEAERDALLDGREETDEVHRYSYRETTNRVALRPALADRPVVVRPEDPLSVPAGEEVTLYLSTLLWIQVVIGDAAKPVHELPSYRASDTWFGTSTRSGELCYAARTAGRLNLDDLPLRRHRAVTPLRVRNEADDTLPIERVQLPTQHLALYEGDGGFLWTQGVTMRRARSEDSAQVEVADGSPANFAPTVGATHRIADPRTSDRKGLVVNTFRAIEALFGQG